MIFTVEASPASLMRFIIQLTVYESQPSITISLNAVQPANISSDAISVALGIFHLLRSRR